MLSSDDKKRVAIALCYPVSILDPASVNYNSVFNDRINIDDEFSEVIIVRDLDAIDALNDKFASSANKGNIKRVDDIEFDTTMGTTYINKEKKRLRDEISNILDIPSNCKSGSMASVCF